MSDYPYPLRRRPRLGSSRPEPPLYESGDYTIPDALESRAIGDDDVFMATDFDDGESTTITRHR